MRVTLKGIVRQGKAKGGALGDSLFHVLTEVVAVGILGLLALVVVILFFGASDSMRAFGPAFLVTGRGVDPDYGALPFVYGTLVTSAIALLIGIPISLGIAVFLSEQAPNWLRVPLTFLVEVLAAVPSVVYGLWGIFVLVPFMRDHIEPGLKSVLGFLPIFEGPSIGFDKLTAGVILAIMVIPTISSVSREALLAVPQSQREAALSLGATRWETTRVAVLRYARSGIFGAAILGLGRAVGETMAVTMTIGNSNDITASLFSPGQTIASLIANNFTEASSLGVSALIELGLVLMLVALVVNIIARLLVLRVVRGGEGVR